MKAEIISVGTELLLGHTINTDAAHVARELSALGVDLPYVHVVGDNAGRLEEVLREALRRSDLVITTGGLGPTDDDLTKETVARVTGAPLEEHSASLEQLREYFGSRPMSANQRKQALLPRGSVAFANAVGTAPGCAVPTGDGKFVLLLPGPPSELLPMLREHAVPFLQRHTRGAIASFMVRTFGIGEGAAEMRIKDLTGGANPTAATYATEGEMFVRVTAKAADAAAAEALAAPLVEAVRRRLGDVVYGVNVASLESVVLPELIRRGQTLVTAESCTGGLLAKRITDQPGASAVFGTGLVTYANEAKTALLGVPEAMLRAHGAVSAEVARCMAENARVRYNGDFGLGITGIAGPGGGTPEKPVGLVYIALSAADGVWLRVMRPRGRYPGRDRIRNRAVGHALDLLRRCLFDLPMNPDAASLSS
ncbi:competence/damage-inducible protein A [uncultured Desulfovibrio sp.]|uniref:competence/damage-inducible protein A n=1 Tax=uncultured Desulfovibrio sp. TaxID=167968 RepID=UPI00261675C8|nr:competence/damage-inducible protein A [uncultured Desulfovibrio sp.]